MKLNNLIIVEMNKPYIPSLPIHFNELKVVEEKPKLEERYLRLNKNYWINLKKSGIDG